MAEKNWGELIQSHSPELDEQNRADREYLAGNGALSSRERYLLAMVLDAIADRPRGVDTYGRRAVEEGATKAQILEALTILRMFAGRPALVMGAEALRQFES